ncbi:hypothetical protein GWK08_13415 [Leptobacterium flavescens]|uniref:DUF4097 family beta strand repeat protein n=1 Tax=Leptobacterium flavescens TaxID=472055 RepID=A0A6P0UN45_9FLAO|nr:hypothetical protein [Leptobacterium flavescens]NER14447.1 hypothetical protein [Leptobacterium flavescens]
MRPRFIIAFFLLSSSLLFAQKTVEKTVVGTLLKGIKVDAHNCFKIEIGTHASPKIRVESSIDGEYSDDLVISVLEKEDHLVIRAGFSPLFKNPNDKLSAHKVISIYLNILVPEGFEVDLLGGGVRTDISGKIKDLKVVLDNGICSIRDFYGNAEVSTRNGNIFLEARQAEVESESRYGQVKSEDIEPGKSKITLKTVNGDIYVSKPK